MVPPGKRKYYRLSVEAPCLIKITREGDSPEASSVFRGMLKDISFKGILLATDHLYCDGIPIFPPRKNPDDPKPEYSSLLVKFTLPLEKDPFVISCEPRWHDTADLGDPFEHHIGARITRISKPDLDRLKQYLRDHGDLIDLEQYLMTSSSTTITPEPPVNLKTSKFYEAVLPIRYRAISASNGRQSRYCRSTTQQISLSGVCIEAETMTIDDIDLVFDDTPVKRNTLEIAISIPGQAEPVLVVGEVHWAERFPSKDGYKYQVGIQFLRISPQHRRILAELIRGKPEANDVANRPW